MNSLSLSNRTECDEQIVGIGSGHGNEARHVDTGSFQNVVGSRIAMQSDTVRHVELAK